MMMMMMMKMKMKLEPMKKMCNIYLQFTADLGYTFSRQPYSR